jgi:Molecular chaperone (small heat shock protein)
MALTKYDPFHDLGDLSSGFRAFQDSVNRLLSEPPSGRPWAPAVDILETDNELIIKADLPQVDMQDHYCPAIRHVESITCGLRASSSGTNTLRNSINTGLRQVAACFENV